MRRYRKAISVALLLLNLSGARVVAVCEACGQSRTYFGPTRSFKAIAKTVTRQQWGQRGTRSLGARTRHRSSRDVEAVQRQHCFATVPILRPASVVLDTGISRRPPLLVRKLPSDQSPVQPPQLFSKK